MKKEEAVLKIIKKLFLILFAFFLVACTASVFMRGMSLPTASVARPGSEATPEPSFEPTPAPTPEPTPEPELPKGMLLTVNGKVPASGIVLREGVEYMSLDEAAQPLEIEPTQDGDAISFTWRQQDVRITVDSAVLHLGDQAVNLEDEVFRYHGAVWVPVRSFCEALAISVFEDGDEQHLYCTPGAGDWALPEGCKVPVLMYHGVNDYAWTMPSLFVTPAEMEEQLVYLLDNGWDPIFFEDLWHVQDYDKPIILTFDDGYVCNYNILFPLLQKYNVKATFFIITNYLSRPADSGYSNIEQYLTWDNLREMDASGLCSIQSHTAEHINMSILGEDSTRREMGSSKLMLTRQIGKEPFVVSYPEGDATELTYQVTREFYRFGVKMSGVPYVTGSDPVVIWRAFVPRGMTLTQFEKLINQ